MRIEMLEAVADHPKGSIVPVEDAVGKRYIAAGFAKEAPPIDPLEAWSANIQANTATVAAKAAAEATAAVLASYQPRGDDRHPARLRIDAGEQQADREKGFADFIKQVIMAGCPNVCPGKQAEANERLVKVYKSSRNTWETKDLAEGSGATGGYTVAPLFNRELLQLAAEESIVRPYANVKAIPAREAYYPMLNQTFTPTGGASAYYGGVNMQWTGEAQPRPATEPNFKEVHVVTHELAGLCKISRTLMSDSMIAMEAELRQIFAGAIAYAEDIAFLNGDGNAKPKGVLVSPATITYGTRATANQFKLADAANMMGAMMPQSRPKAVWVMVNSLFSQLVQLADSTGRVTYLPNVGSGYGDAKLAMGQLLLFGRPVLFTERLPALGTAGDVLAADFSKYIVADTGTLEIAASDQYAFNTNQITFRIIKRVDGQPQLDAPFTQQDGSTQIAPFVILHA